MPQRSPELKYSPGHYILETVRRLPTDRHAPTISTANKMEQQLLHQLSGEHSHEHIYSEFYPNSYAFSSANLNTNYTLHSGTHINKTKVNAKLQQGSGKCSRSVSLLRRNNLKDICCSEQKQKTFPINKIKTHVEKRYIPEAIQLSAAKNNLKRSHVAQGKLPTNGQRNLPMPNFHFEHGSLPLFEVVHSNSNLLYQKSYLLDGMQFEYVYDMKFGPIIVNCTNQKLCDDLPTLLHSIKRKSTKPTDEDIVFGNAKVLVNKKRCSWEKSRIEWLLRMEYIQQQRQQNLNEQIKLHKQQVLNERKMPQLIDYDDDDDDDDDMVVICCVPFKDFAKRLLDWHLDS